jgi:hypothetical protein
MCSNLNLNQKMERISTAIGPNPAVAQCRHDLFAQSTHGPRPRGPALQADPVDKTGEVPGHGAQRWWWPIPGKPTMKGCGNWPRKTLMEWGHRFHGQSREYLTMGGCLRWCRSIRSGRWWGERWSGGSWSLAIGEAHDDLEKLMDAEAAPEGDWRRWSAWRRSRPKGTTVRSALRGSWCKLLSDKGSAVMHAERRWVRRPATGACGARTTTHRGGRRQRRLGGRARQRPNTFSDGPSEVMAMKDFG